MLRHLAAAELSGRLERLSRRLRRLAEVGFEVPPGDARVACGKIAIDVFTKYESDNREISDICHLTVN